ncbi:uncharacterized protein B0H64DRAFT_478093 [Chaetomium fimeti]|uniref:Uncharacterized protein n=1 Tax=Chaetomium fimeti TaxID=1854472 RepID=A0AAE0H8I2_9PEZI|nr:hypothetical protein B0H64DRAFT_478093 [Chaetomium fimeti]
METNTMPSVCRWPDSPFWELDGFDFSGLPLDEFKSIIHVLYPLGNSERLSTPKYSQAVADNVALMFQVMHDCRVFYATCTSPFWERVQVLYKGPPIEGEQLERISRLFVWARHVYRHTFGDCPNETARLADQWIAFASTLHQPASIGNRSTPVVEQEDSPVANCPPALEHVEPKATTSKRKRNESVTSSPIGPKMQGRKANNDIAQSQSAEAPTLPSIEDDYDNFAQLAATALRRSTQNETVAKHDPFTTVLETLRRDLAAQNERIEELEKHKRWNVNFIGAQRAELSEEVARLETELETINDLIPRIEDLEYSENHFRTSADTDRETIEMLLERIEKLENQDRASTDTSL